MVVKTTKFFTALTPKHPLVVIVLLSLLFVVLSIVLFLGTFDFLAFIFALLNLAQAVFLCLHAIKGYVNCRAYSVFDTLDEVYYEKTYEKNSGIQLIVISFIIAVISLLLSISFFLFNLRLALIVWGYA